MWDLVSSPLCYRFVPKRACEPCVEGRDREWNVDETEALEPNRKAIHSGLWGIPVLYEGLDFQIECFLFSYLSRVTH